MTDLAVILPSFPAGNFSSLLPAIERQGLSTTDLLALHPADVARQTRLAVLDLRRLVAAIQASLLDDMVPCRDFGAGGTAVAAEAAVAEAAAETEMEAEAGAEAVPVKEGQDGGGKEAEESESSKGESGKGEESSRSTAGSAGGGFITTLHAGLDAALGGRGVPTGRVTEVAGESGAGKTQLLLALCLAVQLPASRGGLGRKALYVSTESGLATSRLAQMLASNPAFASSSAVDADADAAGGDGDGQGGGGERGWPRPSLDNILSTVTPDLESQDHILQFQVPVLLSRHDVGLVVLDSVAANYRAEFDRQSGGGGGGGAASSRGSNMAARSAELVRLGAHLRDLARRHDLAVVVANQVADRFSSSISPFPRRHLSHQTPSSSSPSRPAGPSTQDTPLASRSLPLPSGGGTSSNSNIPAGSPLPFSLPDDHDNPGGPPPPPPPPALLLDHQQRWFTGWGDDPDSPLAPKTPSLGFVWTTQIACRVALFKRPVYGRARLRAPAVAADDYDDGGGEDVTPSLKAWRRWAKVVFAPHAPPSGQGLEGAVEFEIANGGIKPVDKAKGPKGSKRPA
ncbi:hypothetical protein N3K66_003562 [Trichothecium roseum]|uniref:Uncharacterized protein n=1 Tax=Trichothecium roseum TaxID=47278 RepID=A0ACC0V769_9HYPO|nr:hypothetical protein N3K66_003562 [Trichothecium roseum]